MTDLKPCPFCRVKMRMGYDPKAEMYGPEGEHLPGCIIGNWDMREYSYRRDAEAAWNTRAAHPTAVDAALGGDEASQEAECAQDHIGDATQMIDPKSEGEGLTGHVLEAIAHNLCSLHDFDPAFVQGQERFARAVITEYERARLGNKPGGEG